MTEVTKHNKYLRLLAVYNLVANDFLLSIYRWDRSNMDYGRHVCIALVNMKMQKVLVYMNLKLKFIFKIED